MVDPIKHTDALIEALTGETVGAIKAVNGRHKELAGEVSALDDFALTEIEALTVRVAALEDEVAQIRADMETENE